MGVKRKFLGLTKSYFCDRCGKALTDPIGNHRLCLPCYRRPASTVRSSEIQQFDSPGGFRPATCRLCSASILKKSAFDVCSSCVVQHPDTTHSDWGWRAPLADDSAPYNGLTYHRHCNQCGGVQLVRRSQDGILTYAYYRPGKRTPLQESFECPATDGGWFKAACICYHDWVVLHEHHPAANPDAEYQRLKKNPMLDDISYKHMAYGSQTCWCWKCGFFLHYSKGIGQTLPKVGTSSTYYKSEEEASVSPFLLALERTHAVHREARREAKRKRFKRNVIETIAGVYLLFGSFGGILLLKDIAEHFQWNIVLVFVLVSWASVGILVWATITWPSVKDSK